MRTAIWPSRKDCPFGLNRSANHINVSHNPISSIRVQTVNEVKETRNLRPRKILIQSIELPSQGAPPTRHPILRGKAMSTPSLGPVQSLGYVGLRAKDVDDWSGYGTRLLGLQAVDRSRATLALRMDDRKQRLIVQADGGEGIGFFGWEVKDAAALDRLGAHLESQRFKVAPGSRALADERHVADLIVLNDPLGNRLEFFHGAATATEPFIPGRNISGFRTGPLGLGHVVLHVERIDEMMAFYRDILGFRLSDYFLRPYQLYFFHVNPRHHSIAFAATGKNAVHHMMLELYSLDDVGQGYDLAAGEDG